MLLSLISVFSCADIGQSILDMFNSNASDADVMVWNKFMNSFTGDDEDSAVLTDLLSRKVLNAQEALLTILRSEKSSNGIHDCSKLVNICVKHRGFIALASLEDIQRYFKYWVSHRSRGISPQADFKPSRTLYYFLFCMSTNQKTGHLLNDKAVMQVACALETETPPEKHLSWYFSIEGYIKSPNKLNDRLEALEAYLDAGKPIYNCMLAFAFRSKSTWLHPRMVKYIPVACSDDNWFYLAAIMMSNDRVADAFMYIIDSLDLGAPPHVLFNCADIRQERYKVPRQYVLLLAALLCARSSEPLDERFESSEELAIRGGQYWQCFKLLMTMCECEEDFNCKALKYVFIRELGQYAIFTPRVKTK